MKHIVFSPQALIDVEEIKDYIQSQFGEKAATKNIALIIHDINMYCPMIPQVYIM